jgi:hypothetical protein
MSKVPEPVSEVFDSHDTAVVAKNPKKAWRRHIWGPLDKSPEERKFIFKLDPGY